MKGIKTSDNFHKISIDSLLYSRIHFSLVCAMLLSGASRVVKITRKISFSAGKRSLCAHARTFSVVFRGSPFFILNYSFDTNFGNPAVESSRTIYQGPSCFFLPLFLFFYGCSRADDIVRVASSFFLFFYVTFGQKRSNVKVAREINIPSAWGDYARHRESRIKSTASMKSRKKWQDCSHIARYPYGYAKIYKRRFNTFIVEHVCISCILNLYAKMYKYLRRKINK